MQKQQLMNQHLIKASNMKSLFMLIQRDKAISRIALSKKTKLSKATVSSLIDELIERRYVVDCGTGTSLTAGRKPNTLMIEGGQNYIAVFQWHKLWIHEALIGLDDNVVFEKRVSLLGEGEYLQTTLEQLHECLETYNPQARILGVCIVVPAIIDGERIISTVLDTAADNNLIRELKEQLGGYPITVLNDTSCYAYAECVHNDLEDTYYAFVNIDNGVGAVVIDHGCIFRAANGLTTQFGHFSVDRNGPLCSCGNRGCLERMIGELYLYERSIKEHTEGLFDGEADATFEKLGQRAAEGDERAVRLMDALAGDVAYAISNLISLFNPQEIVIGGEGVALGELYLSLLTEHLKGRGFPLFMERVKLRFTSLSKSSALRGAARYFIDRYFSFDGEMRNTLYIG